ncbi:hypothetical protein BY458DRAFT_498971 [Sporodiniella umbellata]|nr:hypothetical protein BY458DRAFT_498971 [Sporodiniella umbellata]
MIKAARLFTGLNKRYKTTVCSAGPNENAAIKRPIPILLLRVAQDKNDWLNWQKQFSELGYYSVDALIHLPEKENIDILLQDCYEDLVNVSSQLSFFPPLMISQGPTAWCISQKYVSNKPVSGLVLVDLMQKTGLKLPSYPFEPHFPILHLNTLATSTLPAFLEGAVDVVQAKQQQEFKHVLDWMDDIGM